MRYKLRKRNFQLKMAPQHRRIFSGSLWFLIISIIIVSGFYLVDFKIRPTLRYLAAAKAKQVATRAISEAINLNIAPNIKYQNIINVTFDKQGKVAFMQPNTGAINRISAQATLAVQNRIKNLSKQVIKIPLGQIFGLKMLSGFGPNLPVRVFSIGIVESAINDSFDVAGINQIRHRIYIKIKAIVKMVVPLVHQEVQVSSSILLTEAIVMGQVPNIYVNSGGLIIPGDSQK